MLNFRSMSCARPTSGTTMSVNPIWSRNAQRYAMRVFPWATPKTVMLCVTPWKIISSISVCNLLRKLAELSLRRLWRAHTKSGGVRVNDETNALRLLEARGDTPAVMRTATASSIKLRRVGRSKTVVWYRKLRFKLSVTLPIMR